MTYPPMSIGIVLTDSNIREHFAAVKRGLRQDQESQEQMLRLNVLMAEMQRIRARIRELEKKP